jgi:hypothetical protein
MGVVVEAVEDVWRGLSASGKRKRMGGVQMQCCPDHSCNQADHLSVLHRNKRGALKVRVSCTCLKGRSLEGDEEKEEEQICRGWKERGA